MLLYVQPGQLGFDYSAAWLTPEDIKGVGGVFVSRYISGDTYNPSTPQKAKHDLSDQELEMLFEGGIGVQINQEQHPGDFLKGADRGRHLADRANFYLDKFNWPKTLPVVFSCDEDVTSDTIGWGIQFMMGYAEVIDWPYKYYGGTKLGNRLVREGLLTPGDSIWKAMASFWSRHESDENVYLFQKLGYYQPLAYKGSVDWNIARIQFPVWLGGDDNNELHSEGETTKPILEVPMAEYVCNAEVRHFENQDWPVGWLYYEMTYDINGKDVKRRIIGEAGPGRHLGTAIPLTNAQLDAIPDFWKPEAESKAPHGSVNVTGNLQGVLTF